MPVALLTLTLAAFAICTAGRIQVLSATACGPERTGPHNGKKKPAEPAGLIASVQDLVRQPPRTAEGARARSNGTFFAGAAIRPSRMATLRAALRPRCTASAARRTRFSEGFS